jgi:hypothetical protein
MLGQGEGELDGEPVNGHEVLVNITGQNCCVKDEEGNVALPLGWVLVNSFDQRTPRGQES